MDHKLLRRAPELLKQDERLLGEEQDTANSVYSVWEISVTQYGLYIEDDDPPSHHAREPLTTQCHYAAVQCRAPEIHRCCTTREPRSTAKHVPKKATVRGRCTTREPQSCTTKHTTQGPQEQVYHGATKPLCRKAVPRKTAQRCGPSKAAALSHKAAIQCPSC